MTTIDNMLMKFPEGIFAGREPRITNGYVSVFDIIQVAGGLTKNSVPYTL